MLYGNRANLRTGFFILWHALLGGFDSHLCKARIQFSLNICYRGDILKLRAAAIDVALHLCCLSVYKPNSEM